MPTYRRQILGDGGSVAPAVAPLTGLKPLLAAPAVEVMRALDRVVQQGRRTVFSMGIAGTLEWGVSEENPDAMGHQIYPDRTTWRERARARFELTPGCSLQAKGWCLPAGMTQRHDAIDGLWYGNGPLGRVRITATYTARDATVATSTYVITTPHSTLPFAGTDHSAGSLARDMRELDRVTIRPPGFLTNLATQRLYSSQHPTVDILIEVLGSPRIGELTIHEFPESWSCEDADP